MTDGEKLDLILSEVHDFKKEIKQGFVALKEDVSELKADVKVLKEDVSGLKEDVSDLKEEMKEVKQEIVVMKKDIGTLQGNVIVLQEAMKEVKNGLKAVNLTLENEIRVNIKRVAEGHLDLARNLHEAMKPSNELEMLTIRVGCLETEMRDMKAKLA